MSGPRLLTDPDVPEFQRELLRAWSGERPSKAARERAMAFAPLAARAPGNADTAGGSIAPKAISASGPILVKWGGLGAILVGLTAAAVISARSERKDPVAPATEAEPAPASPPLVSAAVAAPAPPSVASRVAPVSVARSQPSATPPSALKDEIAGLDRVLTAAAAGDDPRVVQLVDDYEGRFPHGTFVQEAETLRIEALVREGKDEAASSAADRFYAAYPSSPHVARLRALTGPAAP